MRFEYFTLFGELSCLFSLAYQAMAGVYLDISSSFLCGVFTGHGFLFLIPKPAGDDT
jgi:hypothetical protein